MACQRPIYTTSLQIQGGTHQLCAWRFALLVAAGALVLGGCTTGEPTRLAENRDAEVGDAEVGDAEVGDAEVGDAEVGDAEVGDAVTVDSATLSEVKDGDGRGGDGVADVVDLAEDTLTTEVDSAEASKNADAEMCS